MLEVACVCDTPTRVGLAGVDQYVHHYLLLVYLLVWLHCRRLVQQDHEHCKTDQHAVSHSLSRGSIGSHNTGHCASPRQLPGLTSNGDPHTEATAKISIASGP